jgi:type I restriction enzyme S subunit
MPLVCPSLFEQRHIADYLDELCTAIDEVKRTIEDEVEALRRLRKATIHRAVTKGLDEDVPLRDSGIGCIGEIPANWTVRRLKTYAQMITDGVHQTPDYQAEGIPFLSIKDISSGYIDFSDTRYITEEAHRELSRNTPVEKGDILFTRIGTFGVAVMVDTDRPFDIFVSLGLLKVKPGSISKKYLLYVMNSQYYYDYIDLTKSGWGTAAPKFNLGSASLSPITTPPFAEQQRIADYLDERCAAIDSVIDTRTKQLQRLEDYRKALVFAYVTGKKEVPTHE